MSLPSVPEGRGPQTPEFLLDSAAMESAMRLADSSPPRKASGLDPHPWADPNRSPRYIDIVADVGIELNIGTK